MSIKNITPNVDGEGSLGTQDLSWGTGFFHQAITNTVSFENGSSLSVDSASPDRLNYNDSAIAFYSEIPTDNNDLTNDAKYVTSSDSTVTNIVIITSADYSALTTKDSNTLYILT